MGPLSTWPPLIILIHRNTKWEPDQKYDRNVDVLLPVTDLFCKTEKVILCGFRTQLVTKHCANWFPYEWRDTTRTGEKTSVSYSSVVQLYCCSTNSSSIIFWHIPHLTLESVFKSINYSASLRTPIPRNVLSGDRAKLVLINRKSRAIKYRNGCSWIILSIS